MSGCSSLLPVTVAPYPHGNSDRKLAKGAPSRIEILAFLKTCKDITRIHLAHAKVVRNGLQQDKFIAFELLRACSTAKSMEYATKIFSTLEAPNVFHYTAMIDGHVLSGSSEDGIRLYYQMIGSSIIPDGYVTASVLKACGLGLDLREGKEVHGQIMKLGLGCNRIVGINLIEAYGKCGAFQDAWKVFEKMPEQDVVLRTVMMSCYFDHGRVEEACAVFRGIGEKDTICWTALIDGLVGNGEMSKALQAFREMQRDNVNPNEFTLVCVLSACSHLGALELGRWVHSYLRNFKIDPNCFVGGALINMYARCGDIDESKQVFCQLRDRDVTTYNTMISGLALHGNSAEAIKTFQLMKKDGIQPNDLTFVSLLNACSHGGLAELGFGIFYSMKDYGIRPQVEHYGCMIDLLGRIGRPREAYDFMKSMNVQPDNIMLGSLLSNCKLHGDFELAEILAKILIDRSDLDSGTLVLLANLYASQGRWDDAALFRTRMKNRGIRKEPGCSSIEVDGNIHEFLLGDIRHPERDRIYLKLGELDELLRSEGYSPVIKVVLHDLEDDEEKERTLTIHSERLAICYGLISTEPKSPLRIVKNLRICYDCHQVIKLITKVTERKIVVRDRNRFHHFENGTCSCGDYW
ncbi:hypothetical protein SAY86_012042 [Trapa natans]|uniref:DYW domain-containing protein n=1 Tax=Trapa natans TaxID=22666 RepID=A0AAN7MBA3_TRANT|nr:hypothetical protein SAY86_012042 [Trapa natans]